MHRRLTTSFTLTALVLSITACSSDSSDTAVPSGNVISPVPNGTTTPFTPVPATDNLLVSADMEMPDSDSPTFDTPATTPTDSSDTLTPVAPALSDNSLPVDFYNGLSESLPVSEWQCRRPGNTDPGAYYSLRFFEDASGVYLTGTTVIEFDWLANGNDVSFSFPGDSTSFTLDAISFTSAQQFLTTVQATDQPDDARQCDLFVLGSAPVQTPATNPLPQLVQPDITPTGSVAFAEQLSNGTMPQTITSIWSCTYIDGTQESWVFLDDGQAIVGFDDVSIPFFWSLTSANDISLQFQDDSSLEGLISNPRFQSDDAFQTAGFTFDDEPIGSMSCLRLPVS